jgi:hypothetical protein
MAPSNGDKPVYANPLRRHAQPELLAKSIIAHTPDKAHLSPEPTCRYCLIRPLATVVDEQCAARHRLSWGWETFHQRDNIHIDRTNDENT